MGSARDSELILRVYLWQPVVEIHMAFRIHDSVVRGEIDNRVKGIVRGKIWVVGRKKPVVLELKGNVWPDLAGCLLQFKNPLKLIAHQHLDSLKPEQKGQIGDITASRKVRVMDIPMPEAYQMSRRESSRAHGQLSLRRVVQRIERPGGH